MNDPFLVDECLCLELVATAHARGHYATHVIYRDLGGTPDNDLLPVIADGNFVFVTANARDFLRLYAREPIHSGLVIVVPGQLSRADQIVLFNAVLDTIEPLPDLTNKVVEVFHDRTVRIRNWPTPG